MLMMDPYFTRSVGVAPGTTTMSIAGVGDCPPDERWMYTSPPIVDTSPQGAGAGAGATPGATIDIVQSSATAPIAPTDAVMQPGTFVPGKLQRWNPYATESKLRGLGSFWGDAAPRWGVILFAGIMTFATVLGIGYLRRK